MVQYGQHTTGVQVVKDNSKNVDGKISPSEGTIGGTAVLDLAAAKPAKIFLVGRNIKKTQPVIDKFREINTTTELIFVSANMDDLESVRRAADEIRFKTDKIDVIFNNAGVMATPYQKTKQGHEWQFGINHLAHFVLTARLFPLVEAAAPGAAIINTSSTGCNANDVQFDNINFDDGATYNPWLSYGSSKTANALFSVQLSTLYFATKGVKSFSLQPGMPPTNITEHVTEEGPASFKAAVQMMKEKFGSEPDTSGDAKSLEASTSTMMVAAFDDNLTRESGKFLRNCEVSDQVLPHVLDPLGAEKLWKLSQDLTGEKFPA